MPAKDNYLNGLFWPADFERKNIYFHMLKFAIFGQKVSVLFYLYRGFSWKGGEGSYPMDEALKKDM